MNIQMCKGKGPKGIAWLPLIMDDLKAISPEAVFVSTHTKIKSLMKISPHMQAPPHYTNVLFTYVLFYLVIPFCSH